MKTKTIIFVLLCTLLAIPTYSQQQNKIIQTLDHYGKQKGSVLVQLSKDILSKGSKITFYKSLTVTGGSQRQSILNALHKPLETDWKNLIMLKKEGKIETATYYINSFNNKGTHFLLIKENDKQLVVIYMRADISPSELQQELKKLKNLIIYIDDKKIEIG